MMAIYSCEAVVISSIICTVEAATPEAAVELFRTGNWDDYYDDDTGQKIYNVDCDLATIKEVPK
jgi:hypothetical protein